MSMGGHQSARARTTTWFTPPEILAALGSFDFDPCSPSDRPMETASAYATDGLVEPWHGRVWCNPPYTTAQVTLFMRKMSQHGFGTALVFARNETQWFFESVWRSPTCTGLLFLEGRLHFHTADGKRAQNNAGAPSVLIAYGGYDFAHLAASGLAGALVDRWCA